MTQRIKMLKSGIISKTSLKNTKIEELNYHNTNDIGVNSIGILRLCVFKGSYKKPKFSHYEYYLVRVKNDNYTYKTDYATFSSTTHRFTLEVIQVIEGREKRVHDKFTKRGKNLYGNYYEIEGADLEDLEEKHSFRDNLRQINNNIFNYNV